MKHHASVIRTIVVIVLMFASLFSLWAVSKEENDLVFIISLYEHKQYDLAKKQIALFEIEHQNSNKLKDVIFIKANIALFKDNKSYADSLYTLLLNEQLDNEMLTEILINKARIKFESKDYVSSSSLLSRAELLALDSENKFRIYLLKGQIQSELMDYTSATTCFEKALAIYDDDVNALNGLLNAYLFMGEINQARNLIDELLPKTHSQQKLIPAINTWIDFLTSLEDFELAKEYLNRMKTETGYLDESVTIRAARLNYLMRNHTTAEELLLQCSNYVNYSRYLLGLITLEKGFTESADSIFAELSKTTGLDKPDYPEPGTDIKIKSWLERIKILFNEDKAAALSLIANYLQSQIQPFKDSYILYIYGTLLFQSGNYQEAISTLLKVKQQPMSPQIDHNVQIMLADIWFAAKVKDNARFEYNSYLNRYPQGKFVNHARFNLAMIMFEERKYNEATLLLQSIRKDSSDRAMLNKALYMLAEISFFTSDYNKAIEQYADVESLYVPLNNLKFKISQSYFFLEDYHNAAGYLIGLEPDAESMFPVTMLDANIQFNLGNYEIALQKYQTALPFAKDNADRDEANSFIALTLYRLRRFDEASKIYLMLSSERETPQSYLIMAAKATYHAGDLQQALGLFLEFIELHPESDYMNNVLANTAAIYYNLADYPRATEIWLSLLKRYQSYQSFGSDDQLILSGLFSGMQWCLKQNHDQQVLDELNNMIDAFQSDYIKFELQYLLLKAYYGNEQWSDIIQMADDLRAEFPQKENNEIRKIVATSLAELQQPQQADSVYQQIFQIEPTADILTEWAELDLKAGKSEDALTKLDRAMQLEPFAPRFLKLLDTSYQFLPDSLSSYWNRWTVALDSIPDRASFIWLKWNYDQKRWENAADIASSLLLNPDYQIRSQSQLLLAESLYQQQLYSDAITELYRYIYLYPENPEYQLRAKVYIIRTYAASGQKVEAAAVLSEIRPNLDAGLAKELDALVNPIVGE